MNVVYLNFSAHIFLKYKIKTMGDVFGMVKAMCVNVSLVKLFNLLTGVAGIYITYSYNGIIHQQMLKHPYENSQTQTTTENDKFNFPIAFLIFPTGFAWLVGSIINSFNEQKTYMPTKNLIKSAAMVVISTMTYTVAIYYTNFPIVMMFKSCNLISIILVALMCSKVKAKSLKLGTNKLIVGLIITFGIILYNFFGDKSPQAQAEQGNLWIGLPLLIVSFVADGFLPDFQAQIKDKYKPRPLQMFQKINMWACLISVLYSIVVQVQFVDILIFMWYHPKFMMHMAIMCVISTIGQMFVYRMLTHFKQHIVPFVITTRKIFTVLLSIVFFNHKTTKIQFLAIGIVFCTVTIEFLIEMNKKAGGQMENKNEQRPLEDFSVTVEPKTSEPQSGQLYEEEKK